MGMQQPLRSWYAYFKLDKTALRRTPLINDITTTEIRNNTFQIH